MADIHRFIDNPTTSNRNYVEYVDYLNNTPGIKFDVPSVDSQMIPVRPGDVVAFVGRPGSGKSAIMSQRARYVAEDIRLNGNPTPDINQPGEAALYVTWEQTKEVQEALIQAGTDYTVDDVFRGKVDLDLIKRKAIKRPQLPLWIAGRSIYDAGKSVPPMYIDILFENIIELRERYQIEFKLICFDYLQLIPVRKGEQRYEQVANAILATKDFAMAVGSPVFIGVQAKEEVDKRAVRIPGSGDTYFTSELDHAVDKAFGLMKPIKHHKKGEYITVGNREYEVNDTLFLMSLFKQKNGPGYGLFPLYFDMARMVLGELAI